MVFFFCKDSFFLVARPLFQALGIYFFSEKQGYIKTFIIFVLLNQLGM